MSNSSQNALTTHSSTAVASNGYKFVGWINATGVTVTTSNLLEITLTENSTYTAVFERSDISVKATIGGEARICGYDVENLTGSIHLSAVTYSGYKFLGWYVGDTLLSDKMSVDLQISNINGSIIIAKFAVNSTTNTNNDLNNV